MENRLNQSLKPSASFEFNSVDAEESVKLCLIPGHYDTTEIVSSDDNKIYLAYSNPEAINNAGFQCDQVADDYSLAKYAYSDSRSDNKNYGVHIEPCSKRCRYRDFLNYVRYSGLKVVKMRIQNLTEEAAPAIFNSELEISASSIGSKAGSDFIKLSSHKNAGNYDRSFIDIDLSNMNLTLDETTLVALDVPAGSHFQIEFVLG